MKKICEKCIQSNCVEWQKVKGVMFVSGKPKDCDCQCHK